jgi:hypothetical protein
MTYTRNQETIIEQTGSENWEQVVEWFGGMSEQEILAECNSIWPNDDNVDFAALIYSELN